MQRVSDKGSLPVPVSIAAAIRLARVLHVTAVASFAITACIASTMVAPAVVCGMHSFLLHDCFSVARLGCESS